MSGAANGLRTGEVAERAGVNVQTLRYYERRGLLAEPVRSNGGHRLYPPDTVALLGVIKAAQRLGFTLDEVADLIAAGRGRHPAPDLRQRATDKIAEIDARIADLTVIRAALTDVVDARCDSLTNCTCEDCPIPFLTITPVRPPDRPCQDPLAVPPTAGTPRPAGPAVVLTVSPRGAPTRCLSWAAG
ncbi:MerR family transcriptional regulator [Actinoplanes sp. NPDC089786]|uniref:MerR family transcriptional regulator n=1 Tax=Actinoplanes sp. NPDC089786 TaxID=3155185 RepID=UPI00343C42E9